ncbi:TPA: hypothetical protein ACQUHN_004151 [Bacillus thuringiensis]
MEHKNLYMLALKHIRGRKCANCSQHDLDIKKFTPINEWEADVIYACPNSECNHIEFKHNIFDDDYFTD